MTSQTWSRTARFRHLMRRVDDKPFGNPHGADFPLVAQPQQGRQVALGGIGIILRLSAVDMVDIDVIGAEIFQALFE